MGIPSAARAAEPKGHSSELLASSIALGARGGHNAESLAHYQKSWCSALPWFHLIASLVRSCFRVHLHSATIDLEAAMAMSTRFAGHLLRRCTPGALQTCRAFSAVAPQESQQPQEPRHQFTRTPLPFTPCPIPGFRIAEPCRHCFGIF